jgi:hypothetical protein
MHKYLEAFGIREDPGYLLNEYRNLIKNTRTTFKTVGKGIGKGAKEIYNFVAYNKFSLGILGGTSAVDIFLYRSNNPDSKAIIPVVTAFGIGLSQIVRNYIREREEETEERKRREETEKRWERRLRELMHATHRIVPYDACEHVLDHKINLRHELKNELEREIGKYKRKIEELDKSYYRTRKYKVRERRRKKMEITNTWKEFEKRIEEVFGKYETQVGDYISNGFRLEPKKIKAYKTRKRIPTKV